MDQSWQLIVVGLASGIGGACAVVAAFTLAFKGLERSVKAVGAAMEIIKEQLAANADKADIEKQIGEIDKKLASKLDTDDCAHCHQVLLKDLERGGRQFQELFNLQKETTKALNCMETSVQLMAREVAGVKDTLSQVTRVEMRRPG